MSGGIYTTNKTKTLLSLQDVDVENLTNGQALIYDATTETFTNQDIDNELSSISTVPNELIKKDGTNTNFVRAHILTTDSSVGPLTTQKTTFINSQPPLAFQLSSIESIFNNGFYSMILNPHEGNIEQKGMTLKAFLNEVLVGINTDAPAEGLHLLGNFRIDNNTTQSIRFYNTQGSTKEAGRISVDDNGGGADILFLTRPSGGTEPTEKMIIDKTGNVGIGTNSPSEKLDVDGNITCDDIRVNNSIHGTAGTIDLFPNDTNTNSVAFLQLRPAQTTLGGLYIDFFTNSTTGGAGNLAMRINNSKNLELFGQHIYLNGVDILADLNYRIFIRPVYGPNTYRSEIQIDDFQVKSAVINSGGSVVAMLQPYFNGQIYHIGNFNNVSDDRLKSYETDVSNATDTVIKLKPKFYKKHPTLITDDPAPDLSGVLNYDEYGFIAQELNEDPQLSHFVNQHPDTGIYHVNYIEMIPLLVQTIKELNERIKVLESRE